MRRIVIAVTLMVAASFGADTLMTQDFNAWWQTNNPPTGWRIFHTGGGPMGRGDWNQDSGIAPWTGHPTPFAGIWPDPLMDNTPDSLISPILDCRGYMNVTLRCSANFTSVGPNPYQAQIRYSIDSGATFPYQGLLQPHHRDGMRIAGTGPGDGRARAAIRLGFLR